MTSTTFLNLVPLAPTLHAWFDELMFTFYPSINVLLELLNMEEKQLFNRVQALLQGQPDPGRLAYKDSYGLLSRMCDYHLLFSRTFEKEMKRGFVNIDKDIQYSINSVATSEENPLIPDITLGCNPNIVIQTRTCVLGQALLPDGQECDIHLRLGKYIMALWDFKPGADSLQVLLASRPISVPLGHLHTLSPSSSSSETVRNPAPAQGSSTTNVQVDGVISTASTTQPPPAKLLPLTPPPSLTDISSLNSNTREHQYPAVLVIDSQSYPLAERGISVSYSSTEWAKLCYGVDLTSSKIDSPA